MKVSILLTTMLAAVMYANAQAPYWVKGMGGQKDVTVNASVTDTDGNTFITGFYADAMLPFGSDTLINVDTSGNSFDVFLAKYSPSGDIVWAKSAGGTALDEGTAICLDAAGNIYIMGFSESPALAFDGDTLRFVGAVNTFIAKYTALGNIAWAKNNTDSIIFSDIAADMDNNLYVVGSFTAAIAHFKTIPLSNHHKGSTAAFIVKYDSSGDPIWAECTGGYGDDAFEHVRTYPDGKVAVSGSFTSSSINFQGITLTGDSTTKDKYMFLTCLNQIGRVVWAKSVGNLANGSIKAITTDDAGYCYIIGDYTSATIAFDNDTLVNTVNNGANTQDVFIAKYDTLGNVNWARNVGAAGMVSGMGISADKKGHLYVAGDFSCPELPFGNDTLLLYTDGNGDVFVTKYDTAGNVIWATSITGAGYCTAANITADSFGNAYVAGIFNDPILHFGTDSLVTTGSIAHPVDDIFLVKYVTDATTGIFSQQDVFSGITVYPNPSTGQFYFKGMNSGSMLEIYDVLGQTIYSTTVTGDNYLLNISGNAKGIYFYRVADKASHVQQGKMILE